MKERGQKTQQRIAVLRIEAEFNLGVPLIGRISFRSGVHR